MPNPIPALDLATQLALFEMEAQQLAKRRTTIHDLWEAASDAACLEAVFAVDRIPGPNPGSSDSLTKILWEIFEDAGDSC